MAPAPMDIEITTGDTEQITVNLTNGGSPVNITGRSYAAQIRPSALSSTIIATFTCTITNAALGIVICSLSATETAALTPVFAVWDLQETNGSAVTTLVSGKAIVSSDVTRV